MSELYKKHRPKSFSEVIGQDQATNPLQKMLEAKRLPHTILLCGPKGCLKGDTLIFDPMDGSNVTVKERWKKGTSFNVLSFSSSGDMAVTEAQPPVQYPPVDLFRVETSESIFYVSEKHQFLSHYGTYLSLKELISLGFSSIPLLSIEGLSQTIQQQDEHCYQQKEEDFQVYYPNDSHFYDELLQLSLDNDQEFLPLPNDVLEHNHYHCNWDGSSLEEEHSHAYQSFSHPSMQGSFPSVNYDHASMEESSFFAEKHLQLCNSYQESLQCLQLCAPSYTNEQPSSLVAVSNNVLPNKGLPKSSKVLTYLTPFLKNPTVVRTSIKSIRQECNENFYDFHVPIYNNYWAGGVFHHNCGKTSIGRIIRKELKCSKWDFKEVNCANKRGVDTIRHIEHEAHILPMKGKTRIWLMDECHMLTGEASNAFLKILEDTPSHVYFILCTTDPQKLIATIRSRATIYPIKPLISTSINEIIKRVCEKEKIKISKTVSDKIVSLSDDSARDALVFLDKIALLDKEKDQLEAISEASVEAAAIQIARTLVNPRTTWIQMAKVLKETQKEDAEGMRWMILGYAKAILLNGRKDDRAFQIIQVFRDNWYDCKAAGLVACCYEIINGT